MAFASRLVLLAALAGLAALPADAGLRDRIRERMAERFAEQIREDQTPGGREMAYGKDPLQTLAFWPPSTKSARPAPLILFVHGGGWKRGDRTNATGKAKVAHFPAQGYALASINYRLVPAATVEQQAADVAAALAHVRAHAGELGIDPARIVLMGHSAGAHLVALVGTDPRYLAAAGLDETALAGVVALDGAAYDVPGQMQVGARFMGPTYAQAFGTDPARQRALSPSLQAAPPNAPAFLILHVQRKDGIAQSQGLADALRKGGTSVRIEAFEGRGLQGHMDINRKLGLPDYPATALVDRWLRERFGG
jgi:acetyl esterase/lipase